MEYVTHEVTFLHVRNEYSAGRPGRLNGDPPHTSRTSAHRMRVLADNRSMASHELSIVIPVLNDTERLRRQRASGEIAD